MVAIKKDLNIRLIGFKKAELKPQLIDSSVAII